MGNFMTALGALFAFIAVIIVVGLVLSLPVMLLWNYCLVGAVAGVSEIGWLQAWGIMLLCAFLFKPTISKN